MNRLRLWPSSILALLLAPLVRADAPVDLLADDVISDIGLARVADEAGDDTLLSALSGGLGRKTCLTAIRASAYAYAPERLWAALFALSCGRDPVLAPEAAATLGALTLRLRGSEFASREALLADLRAARGALVCPSGSPQPRLDIAALQARFNARLDALLREFGAP